MFQFKGYEVAIRRTLVVEGEPALKLVPALAYRRVRLIWEGPPEGPVIRLLDCPEPYVADFDIVASQPVQTGIEVCNTGTLARPSTMPIFDRVRFFGNNKMGDGIMMISINGANNEHAHLRNVKGFGLKGFLFHVPLSSNKQSKEHRMDQCCQEGGQGAVRAPSAFMWRGGTVSGTSEAAFQLYGGGGDRVHISDVGVEACARLLDLGTEPERTSDGWKVTLDNVRYAADQLAADGHMIRMYGAGPLTVENCQLGGGKVPVLPVILADGYGQPLIRLAANFFDAFGAHRQSPVFTAPGREVVVDWGLNTYANDDGDPTRVRVLGAWR